MAETISEIDSNRDLLCCRLKTWLQLLALSQRSILCHWDILLASVLPQHAGAFSSHLSAVSGLFLSSLERQREETRRNGERDRTEAEGGWQGVSESAVSAKVRPEVTWNDCLTRRF